MHPRVEQPTVEMIQSILVEVERLVGFDGSMARVQPAVACQSDSNVHRYVLAAFC